MSFKREGNDLSLLTLQKKRRITELLGPEIPDDEVAMLNDGRLTCVLCSSVPVFDTIDILKIHRNSRRHKESHEAFLRRKQLDLSLIEKRLQETKKTNGDRSKLLEKKNQLLQKRPFVAPSKSRSRKWQPKPKLQWKMSGEIAVDSMKEVPLQIENACVKSQSPSASADKRSKCLDKVAATVQSTALKKFTNVSKLDEKERKEIREKELYMKSQGYLRDKDGKWVKDPDVEFDSDDEAPL